MKIWVVSTGDGDLYFDPRTKRGRERAVQVAADQVLAGTYDSHEAEDVETVARLNREGKMYSLEGFLLDLDVIFERELIR